MSRVLIVTVVLTLWQLPSRATAQPDDVRGGNAAKDAGAVKEPGYLGVIADDRTGTGTGVDLLEVVPDSPAEKAGLKAGDLVTKVNDQAVRSLEDFAEALEGHVAGDKLRFNIEREGKPKVAEVTLTARPPAEERRFPKFGRINDEQPRARLLGVRVEPVDPDSPIAATLPAPQGAYVVRVAQGSPAAAARIPLHAVIVAVDGQQVADIADLKELIAQTQAGQEIKVDFYFRGKLQERRVRLTEAMPELPPPDDDALPGGAGQPRELLSDAERIEQLERRIRQLEARLSQLERALGK